MESIEGIIVDPLQNRIFEGCIYYDDKIRFIEERSTNVSQYILPGFVDSHVHIESSMLTPFNYSKIALKNGVVAAVTDPHEIANVCGLNGINFMIESAALSPMKMYFGIPSCVPATAFETNGGKIDSFLIAEMFDTGKFSHLSEMMDYPGVISNDKEIIRKLDIAKANNKKIDGHAPLLEGTDLRKYVNAGISTDHECTSIDEALKKIDIGMKILLRKSSASNDYDVLMPLLLDNFHHLMLCVDDCHPDDLLKGYINLMVKDAVSKGYPILNVLTSASVNPVKHYNLNTGLLQVGDAADFIVVDNISDFNILKTVIDGFTCWDGRKLYLENSTEQTINNFYSNDLSTEELNVPYLNRSINVIQVVPNSLLTRRIIHSPKSVDDFICSDIEEDILKIVVVNRYQKSKPVIGFINGFGLKEGAIAGSIAHDSHNIIAIGVDDASLVKAIKLVQQKSGGLAIVTSLKEEILPLPIAGLMSNSEVEFVAEAYKNLLTISKDIGCTLHSPFMTMAFMSLLVIPEIKIGDKGLFDVNTFSFIDLHHV